MRFTNNLCCRPFGRSKKNTEAPVSTEATLKTPTAGTQPVAGKADPDSMGPESSTVDLEKTRRIKGQVDEVTNIMSQNIDQAKKRGENLENLQDKVQDLEAGAGQFSQNSAKVKKNLWYKNMKMTVYLTIAALVVIGIIVGIIIWQTQSGKS